MRFPVALISPFSTHVLLRPSRGAALTTDCSKNSIARASGEISASLKYLRPGMGADNRPDQVPLPIVADMAAGIFNVIPRHRVN